MSLSVQPWSPEHKEGAIRVVRSVFEEYSFTWDPEDYHADLYDVPGHYLALGHKFFVAISEGEVVGTAALELTATVPNTLGSLTTLNGTLRASGCDCELNRLYVAPSCRRQGAGSALIERVIVEAIGRGRTAMEIWSDKRYLEAHRLYGRYGAEQIGQRICGDPDKSPEWGLVIDLLKR